MLLIGAAVLASLFAAGCGEECPAPKAALKNFFKAEAAGYTTLSYRYLSSADKKQIDTAAWSTRTEPLTGGAPGKKFHFIMSDAVQRGGRATIDVLIGEDSDAADALDARFLMVREGGAWKVSLLKTIAGPVRRVRTGGGISWSNVAFGSGTELPARTIVYLVVFLAVYAFYGIGLQRIARVKGLRRPWFAWVPIFNVYIAWKIAGKGVVSTVLSLIQVVNIVMYVLFCFKISRACGKGRLYGFLQIIPILNFVIFWLLVETVEDGAAAAPAPQPA